MTARHVEVEAPVPRADVQDGGGVKRLAAMVVGVLLVVGCGPPSKATHRLAVVTPDGEERIFYVYRTDDANRDISMGSSKSPWRDASTGGQVIVRVGDGSAVLIEELKK